MSLWDDFTGASARGDINAGKAAAEGHLQRGLDNFRSTRTNYLDRSLGEFDAVQPDIKMGRDANNLYRIALGLDGRDAQAGFFNNFNNDPGYQAIQDNAVGAVEGSAAARGGLFSGGTVRGITDRVSLLKNNMFTDRLNRLAQLGTQGAQLGFNTAASRSNLLNGAGTDIANTEFGFGQLRANNEVSAANALASTRNATLNNLIKVGEFGGKVVGAAMGNPMAFGGGSSSAGDGWSTNNFSGSPAWARPGGSWYNS